jgi:phosphate transport system protein
MAQQHIVTSFEDDLQGLARSIAEMGGRAEQLVERSIQALLHSDPDLAHHVIEADRKVDELDRGIEERAILVIARRQPMAQDLRETIAAIRISSDLERIGDLGKNIARRTLAIGSQTFSNNVRVGVEHLAELALRQVKKSLDAYATRDLAKAQEVCARDDEIDAIYNSLFRQLLTYMMEDARNISMCTHLLFCAKNIERIGDHATNIAETIHYLITGEQWDEPRQSSTRVDA